MGIFRIPKDYEQLLHTHQQLLGSLRQGAALQDNSRQQVLDAADNMRKARLSALLREIPVEELNRDKRGIRVASLKNEGYLTVEDIRKAGRAELAAVSGVSEEGAIELKIIAAAVAVEAEKNLKIRLSADERTEEAGALLRAVYEYQNLQEPAKACRQMAGENEQAAAGAFLALRPGRSSIQWMFAPKEEKQAIESSYAFLTSSLESGYGPRARGLLEGIRQIQAVETETLWQAFCREPMSFIHTLEELCPGVLGNDDGLYGLPQDLARKVSQTEFLGEGLRCQLRRYQEWGVRYILCQKNVLLGDEMGLGKTVQAIAVMVSLRNSGGTHFLVICPASVIENWVREITKHSDLTAFKIHGEDREQVYEKWLQTGGVAVTNYETAKIFHLPDTFRFALAVVDEAHYIKNPEAQRTQRVQEICTHADSRLFMTGTAMENRVEEMVTLLTMLQPEIADTAERMAALSTAPQFKEAVAPVYYRRKRDAVLTELPELTETEQWCELGPEEEAIYEEAVLEGHYTEARRVSWNAADPMQSCKAQRMLEIIEDAQEDGRKVIVFSFFLDTIQTVRKLLGDRCLEPINGSVPVSRRQEIVDEFTAAPAGTVLAAQIQAGGTGLNIQSASVIILCEPQFKPSIENQAISRAYRMGQTRNVLVYRLLCEDTVDEEILILLKDKQAEFDTFADDSAAARDTLELDNRTFGTILEKEAQRIREKRGLPEQTLPEPRKTAEQAEEEKAGEPEKSGEK